MKIIQQTNMNPKQTMGYTVVAKSGQVLVIDGGYTGNDTELKRIVKSVGGHIDLWLITHPHCDHHNAVMQVIKNPEGITYDKLGASWLPDQWAMENACDREELLEWNAFARENLDERYFDLKIGDTFRLGTMKVEILGVSNPEITVNPYNNQSVVIRVTEDGFKMLFLGDLGIEAGEKLLARGVDVKADGVQMAHHGQKGVQEDFYQKVQPEYAFWSTPDWLWTNTVYVDGKPEKGPFDTQKTAKWMEKLNTVNIFSFEYTVMFDTETKKITEY